MIRFCTQLFALLTFVLFSSHSSCSYESEQILDALVSRAVAINDSETVTGSYSDNVIGHGFIRFKDGDVISFDAPDAQSTSPADINDSGAITGNLYGLDSLFHGFLRNPSGYITVFDAPGAGTNPNQGTIPTGLNQNSVITGYLIDSANVYHGFVRQKNQFTIFDVPGAGSGPGQGTQPQAINQAGTIVGTYFDAASNNTQSFIRSADGKIAPVIVHSEGSVTLTDINDSGTATGTYVDPAGLLHGVLLSNGKFTFFDMPEAGNLPGQGTRAFAINARGAVTGSFDDGQGNFRVYVRSPNGKYTIVDPPVESDEVVSTDINSCGAISGFYYDESGIYSQAFFAKKI